MPDDQEFRSPQPCPWPQKVIMFCFSSWTGSSSGWLISSYATRHFLSCNLWLQVLTLFFLGPETFSRCLPEVLAFPRVNSCLWDSSEQTSSGTPFGSFSSLADFLVIFWHFLCPVPEALTGDSSWLPHLQHSSELSLWYSMTCPLKLIKTGRVALRPQRRSDGEGLIFNINTKLTSPASFCTEVAGKAHFLLEPDGFQELVSIKDNCPCPWNFSPGNLPNFYLGTQSTGSLHV